jgi:DNA-binding CsgD family transcriptional regulator
MNDQVFGSGLNLGGGQQYAMADEPPPPVSGNKPPAAPIRPVPMRGAPAPLSPQIIQSVKDQTLPASEPKTLRSANQNGPAFKDQEENVSRLMELMAKGKTQKEIADELGVGERTVRRFQTEQLSVRGKRFNLEDSPELQAEYKDMVGKGFSIRQMSDSTGINMGTVSKHLKALNQMGETNFVPQGGARTPSMPTFNFKDKPGEIDRNYIKALEKYLKDMHSWIATNSNAA